MYLVRGGTKDMLVDGGFGFVSLLQNLSYFFKREVIAVATHSHCDHIGCLCPSSGFLRQRAA
jgi:hypothetical protein